MVKGKKFILAREFQGFPKESDVEMVEEVLPPLKNGEYLCETVFLSVDPYQRALCFEVGDTIEGHQVAKIIESKSSKYPVGSHIVGYYGWKSHNIFNETSISGLGLRPLLIPDDYEDIPLQDFIGILGIPGLSAYVGLMDVCQPKPGNTVVVSAAAGAVGSVVGQIAKIKGCRAIGVVGSEEKGKWVTNDLGFDGYINYQQGDFPVELRKLAPEGVDSYFDNVSHDN